MRGAAPDAESLFAEMIPGFSIHSLGGAYTAIFLGGPMFLDSPFTSILCLKALQRMVPAAHVSCRLRSPVHPLRILELKDVCRAYLRMHRTNTTFTLRLLAQPPRQSASIADPQT